MGFECSFIKGTKEDNKDFDSYKNPVVNAKSEAELDEYTGIGVYLGKDNEFRAIDIDDFHIQEYECSNSNMHNYAKFFFIKKCMNLLGLPEDYEWLIKTPHGWHIVISASSFDIDKAAYFTKEDLRPNVISGHVIHFSSIELLWNSFLVMPPSKYGKYDSYYFYNEQPKALPLRVDAAHILNFLCFYCGEFKYITNLSDFNCIPIIGDAHLFPHYELNCASGSLYYDTINEDITESEVFLKACRNSLGFNMQGFKLVYNDLVKKFKIEKNLDAAIKYFRMANNEWGHYNLACLIAIGALNGSIEELYKHIELSQGVSEEYKDQLKLLYLAKNHSYERYAIIDISINDKKRIDKIAILTTDAKGNVLDRSMLSSDSVMLQNMYYALESADYIVGSNLSAIEDNIKKECEVSWFMFSEEMVGVSTGKGEFAIHNEGYYLDSFNKPWIDLPQLNIKEKDPFRRVYEIKEIMVTWLQL